MSDQVIRVRCGNFFGPGVDGQLASSPFGVELSPIDVRDAAEIERAVAAFAREFEWRPDRDGEFGDGGPPMRRIQQRL